MIFFFEKPYIFISRFMMNWEKKITNGTFITIHVFIRVSRCDNLEWKSHKEKSHTINMWQLFFLFLFWKECHINNMLKIKHITIFVTFVTFFWKNWKCYFPKNDERKMTLTKWYKKSRDNNTGIYLGTIGTKGTSKPHLFREGIFFIRCFSGIKNH